MIQSKDQRHVKSAIRSIQKMIALRTRTNSDLRDHLAEVKVRFGDQFDLKSFFPQYSDAQLNKLQAEIDRTIVKMNKN